MAVTGINNQDDDYADLLSQADDVLGSGGGNNDDYSDLLSQADSVLGKAPGRSRRPYDDLFEKHAAENGLDPDFLRSVANQESTFNPGATSYKGASGLMQLMPATARRFGVKDIYDPDQNIGGGAKYLRFLLDRFNGNVPLALAGYNAGEGAVDKYKGVPPYKETKNYVSKITSRYKGAGYGSAPDIDSILKQADDILGTQTPPTNPTDQPYKPVGQAAPIAQAPQSIQDITPQVDELSDIGQAASKGELAPSAADVVVPKRPRLTQRVAQPTSGGHVDVSVDAFNPIDPATGQPIAPVQAPREVGKPTDDPNAIAFTYRKKPGESPEDSIRNALLTGGTKYGITPQDVDDYIAKRKQAGIPVSTDPEASTLGISYGDIEGIKGTAGAAKEAIRTDQAQDRTHLEEMPKPALKDYASEDAQYLRSKLGDTGATFVTGLLNQGAVNSDVLQGLLRNYNTLSDVSKMGGINLGQIPEDVFDFMKADGAKELNNDTINQAGGENAPWNVKLASFGSNDLVGGLGRLMLLSPLPGGAITAMAVDEQTQAAAQNKSLTEQTKAAAHGATIGTIFHFAPSVGKIVGDMTESAIKREFATLGTIFTGTVAAEKGFGSGTEQAVKSGIINSLFHLQSVGTNLIGKSYEAQDSEGNKYYGFVYKDGTIRESKTPIQDADVKLLVTDEAAKNGAAEVTARSQGQKAEAIPSQDIREVGPVFTRKSLRTINPEDTAFAKKGAKIDDSEPITSQLNPGDRVTFFVDKERTGVWDGKHVVEDKTGSPWGIMGILSGRDSWLRNDGPEAGKTVEPIEKTFDSTDEAMSALHEANKRAIEREQAAANNEAKTELPERPAPVGETPLAQDQTVEGETTKEAQIVSQTGPQPTSPEGKLKEQRDVARRTAETDPLTGAANRVAGDKMLERWEGDPDTSVITFDMNGMKKVNDELGHAKGDELLKEKKDAIAQASKEVGDGQEVVRPGGDEFFTGASTDKADAVARRAEEIFGVKTFEGKDGKKFQVSITGTTGKTLAEADSKLTDAKTADKLRHAEESGIPAVDREGNPLQEAAQQSDIREGDAVNDKSGSLYFVDKIHDDGFADLIPADDFAAKAVRYPLKDFKLYSRTNPEEPASQLKPVIDEANIFENPKEDVRSLGDLGKVEDQTKNPELADAANRFVSEVDDGARDLKGNAIEVPEPPKETPTKIEDVVPAKKDRSGERGSLTIPTFTEVKTFFKSLLNVKSRHYHEQISDPLDRMADQHRSVKGVEFESARLTKETARTMKDEDLSKDQQIAVIDAMEHDYQRGGKYWTALNDAQKRLALQLKPVHDAIIAYNRKYQIFTEAELGENMRYLFHWWKNPETGRAFRTEYGEFAKTGPSGRQRTVTSYEEGRNRENPLEMASTNPGEILGKSMQQLIQVKEARDLTDYLKGWNLKDADGSKLKGIVNKIPKGQEDRYVSVDIPALNQSKFIPQGEDAPGLLVKQPVFVLKELAPKLEAYFKDPKSTKLDDVLGVMKSIKLALTFFHGLSLMLKNNTMLRFRNIHDIRRGLEFAKDMDYVMKYLHKGGLDSALKRDYEDIHSSAGAFREGSMMGQLSDVAYDNPMTKLIFSVVRPGLKNAYAHDAFLKYESKYIAVAEKAKGRELTELELDKARNETARAVVKRADSLFSGEDMKLGAIEASKAATKYYFSPEARRAWRIGMISATWQREHLIELKDVVKSLTMPGTMGPISKEYTKQVFGSALILAVADVYNYFITKWTDGEGHHMWDNPSGSKFSIRAPWNEPAYKDASGKTIHGGPAYIRPFKAITEIPDVVASMFPDNSEDGDVVDKLTSKLNPVIGAAINQAKFSDSKAKKGYIERGKLLVTDLSPIAATVPVNIARGRRNPMDLIPWFIGASLQKPKPEKKPARQNFRSRPQRDRLSFPGIQ